MSKSRAKPITALAQTLASFAGDLQGQSLSISDDSFKVLLFENFVWILVTNVLELDHIYCPWSNYTIVFGFLY